MTQKQTEYELYDDPSSQIRFLETALGSQEWRARIHVPDFAEDQQEAASRLTQNLKKRGFKVHEAQDSDGHITLSIHHLGDAPNISGLLRDYGFTTGAAHVVRNPITSLKALLGSVNEGVNHAQDYIKDPARANGAIFLTAEGFLFAAAGGNPHGKWYTPKNLLQGVSASCFLSQSAAYMFWAKKGDDRIAGDYKEQLGTVNDGDFSQLLEAKQLTSRPTNHLFDGARRVLEDHPIQTGAMLNNAGMLAYMGHAILEREHRKGLLKANPNDVKSLHYIKKGFPFEIGSTIVSMLGWSALLLTPKEYEQKSDNRVESAWQSFRENPQRFTSFTSILSSSQRLFGSISKENKLQAIGESIYIPGDILLFFVKNHDYGASRHGDYDGLINKVGAVIQAMPVITSPEKREELYASSASYLAKQHAALAGEEQPLSPQEQTKEEEALREGLRECCDSILNDRFNDMIEKAKALISHFPPSKQEAASALLADTLPTLNGVHVQVDECRQSLEFDEPSKTSAYKTPKMNDIATSIGQLVFSIPGDFAGENALMLYQALSAIMQTEKNDQKQLENTMLSEAKKELGIQPEQANWQSRSHNQINTAMAR